MIRTIALLGLLAVIALGANSARADDVKIWVSADGNAPPGGYGPEYETYFIWDAVDYINNWYKQGNGATLYTDTFTILVDDGVYYETLTGSYRLNMINNLTLKSASGDPTKCIIDNGGPPAGVGVANTVEIRSCVNLLIEGITITGSQFYRLGGPDIGERYPRKTFYNYVEMEDEDTNGVSDHFSVYMRDGTPITLAQHVPFDAVLGTTLTGDPVELPQPVGIGIGKTSSLAPGTQLAASFTIAAADPGENAPGDRAWFHTRTWCDAVGNYVLNAGVDWNQVGQDGIVAGDVHLSYDQGFYGVDGGGGLGVYAFASTGGSGDGYVPNWFMTVTLRNCIVTACHRGVDVRQHCAIVTTHYDGGPEVGDKAWATLDHCTVSDIQGWEAVYTLCGNTTVENCLIDRTGGVFVYSPYWGSLAQPDHGHGIGMYGDVWSGEEYPRTTGPFDVNVLNTTISNVNQVDVWYVNTGIGIHDWDNTLWWYDPVGLAGVPETDPNFHTDPSNDNRPWGMGGCSLTVDGSHFEDNFRDMWICDRHARYTFPDTDGDQGEVHIQNSSFMNAVATAFWSWTNGVECWFEHNSAIKQRGKAYPFYDITDIADYDTNLASDSDDSEDYAYNYVYPDVYPREDAGQPVHVTDNYFQGARLGVLNQRGGVVTWTDNTIVDGGNWPDEWWVGGFWSDCNEGSCTINDMWVMDSRGHGLADPQWNTAGWHECNNVLVTGHQLNGLWAAGSTWLLNKCTFAHSVPTDWGDGIACNNGYVFMDNCIVAFNAECGIVNWGAGMIDAYYSDVYGNAVNPDAAADGYTDFGDGPYTTGPPNIYEGVISLDPLFAGANPTPPAGRTMLFPCWDLSPGSPCIDTGDPDPSYNDPDASRADMGAIPYGTHELTMNTNLVDGQNWLGIPLCPYDPKKDAKELLSLDPGLRVTITRYDNALRSWLGYGDFTYVRPGDMLWVYIAPGGKRAIYPVSATGVKVRASVEIEIRSAGHLFFSCPYEYPYNLHDLEVTKYSNVGGTWTVLERRTMLQDFYSPTTWIDWHLAFYHDFGLDYFNQPEANDNWLVPWQGYYMSIRASALPPDGSQKLGLKFFRDSNGAVEP
jgi:hypothetical protein